MADSNSSPDMNKYLFINLVTMLGMSAMQQLGKLVDPAAGKAAVNLDAAQATIDTLDMLALKTQGNLDTDEARIMKDTLSALKLNYVETKEMKNAECRMQNEKQAQSGGAEKAKSEPKEQEQTKPSEPKSGSGQTNDPKFHKTYS